jgi:hypothetical protein
MNAGKFIDFLKALLDSVPGKIFLIVDGHPVHKAKKLDPVGSQPQIAALVNLLDDHPTRAANIVEVLGLVLLRGG